MIRQTEKARDEAIMHESATEIAWLSARLIALGDVLKVVDSLEVSSAD